jgi:glutaredoxin 3
MAEAASAIDKRRVEIFSAGCTTCQRTIEQLQEHIDPRHEIVIHDLHADKAAAARADAFGIRTVPAVVVDGFLLACCKNKGPTLRELHAAGLAKPGQLQLESS